MSRKDSKWLTDYEAFLEAEHEKVPAAVTEKVFNKMNDLINPSAWLVFSKIAAIHMAVGFLSLSICHQFGMNPFGTEMSLDGWFMAMWGHHTCMIVCGTLFTSASVLSAGYFLSIEEIRALKRTEFLQAFSLGALSLIIFIAFGAEIALAIAALWLLGAMVGGYLATQTIWKFKKVTV